MFIRRNICRTLLGVALFGLMLGLAGDARADRVVSRKVQGAREHGVKPDIFIPYHTNGRGTLGVYQGVEPITTPDRSQDNEPDAQHKPTWNLIFYGSKLQPGSNHNGPTQRKPNVLRPEKYQK